MPKALLRKRIFLSSWSFETGFRPSFIPIIIAYRYRTVFLPKNGKPSPSTRRRHHGQKAMKSATAKIFSFAFNLDRHSNLDFAFRSQVYWCFGTNFCYVTQGHMLQESSSHKFAKNDCFSAVYDSVFTLQTTVAKYSTQPSTFNLTSVTLATFIHKQQRLQQQHDNNNMILPLLLS